MSISIWIDIIGDIVTLSRESHAPLCDSVTGALSAMLSHNERDNAMCVM